MYSCLFTFIMKRFNFRLKINSIPFRIAKLVKDFKFGYNIFCQMIMVLMFA